VGDAEVGQMRSFYLNLTSKRWDVVLLQRMDDSDIIRRTYENLSPYIMMANEYF
jgi:hypothetical protein